VTGSNTWRSPSFPMIHPHVFIEERPMDTQTFDQLTRLFGTAGSRRTACRALLAGVLLGGATRGAVAASCRNGKPACGTACCPG
jgi:hypothetical protein